MSTRVHELAKELGLKSPELLDRIQKWGLDVKVSALASLDPSTVERIRELMKQPTAGKETRGEGVAEPAAVSSGAQTGTAAKLTPRPVATVAAASSAATSAPSAGGPAVGRPVGPGPAAARATGAPPSPAVETPMPAATSSAPAPSAAPTSPVTVRPVATAAPSGGLARAASEASTEVPSTDVGPGLASSPGPPSGPARSVPLSSPPLARPGGGFSGTRPAGGPLSAHTPHRSSGVRPGGQGTGGIPPAESRLSRPQGPASASPGVQETPGGTANFQPLKRSDYMSSAGIRPPVQRTNSAPPASPAPARRPGDEAVAEGARRESPGGPRRPLPPVAAPQAPSHRPAAPSRPVNSGGEGKSQRPEKRMTREDMLNLMRSGQLGTAQAPSPPAWGGAYAANRRGCPAWACRRASEVAFPGPLLPDCLAAAVR